MRYSRQTIFEKIGEKGQKILGKSKVAIVGLGGLGTHSANLLARAGVGELILVDRDVVELSNLQRQTLFAEEDIGKPKATQVEIHLKEINKETKLKAYVADLDNNNIDIIESDLVLDCTDNLETRYLINEFCIKQKIPWVHASCVRDIGTVLNVMPDRPCFKCVFGETLNPETCDNVGILNTVVAMISSIQVDEGLKILLEKDYCKDLMRVNIWKPELRLIKVRKNPKCTACKREFEYLSGEKLAQVVKFCGTGNYQVKGKPQNLKVLKKRLSKLGKVADGEQFIKFRNMLIFKDGRALIKAKSEKQAKTLYSNYIGN